MFFEDTIQDEEIIVIYGLDNELYMNNFEIINNQLSGFIISKISSRIKSQTKMRIYLKETLKLPEGKAGNIVIPLNEIKKVEVKDSAQNTAIAITGLIGFLLVVGLIALLSSGIKLGGFSKF